MTVDAKARLERVIAGALNDGWQHEAGRLADALLAAGVTLPEPVKPGQVVSHEAINALARLHGYKGCSNASHYDLCPSCKATAVEVLDGTIPVAEVERRARAWWDGRDGRTYGISGLVAALTAPEGK